MQNVFHLLRPLDPCHSSETLLKRVWIEEDPITLLPSLYLFFRFTFLTLHLVNPRLQSTRTKRRNRKRSIHGFSKGFQRPGDKGVEILPLHFAPIVVTDVNPYRIGPKGGIVFRTLYPKVSLSNKTFYWGPLFSPLTFLTVSLSPLRCVSNDKSHSLDL